MTKSMTGIFIMSLFLFINSLNAQNNNDLFFVFLNTNPDKPQISEEEINELQTAHLENIGRLAEEGIMLAAGPFDGGGGLFILETESLESANQILYSDPAIKANRFKLEVYPFELVVNDICVATEPYEMVTYQFVRLKPQPNYFGKVDLTKSTNKNYFSKLNKNNDFVVVHGSFGNEGGMIIFDFEKPQQAADIISENPLVKEGQLEFEIRPLWIAKGTFCKK